MLRPNSALADARASAPAHEDRAALTNTMAMARTTDYRA